MKNRNVLCFFLFSMIFCLHVIGQDALSNLIEVGEKDLQNGIDFKKDIEDVSFYDLQGNLINMKQADSFLASNNYFPQFYTDKNNEVVAIMIKKMSDKTPSAGAKFKSIRILKAKKKKNLSKKFIDFSAVDMDNESYVLSDLKGKVVVMNFWFIRCKPCVYEMPGLNKIVEKYKNNQDVVFLAFSFDRKSDIESFLEKHSFLYQIIPQSKKIISSYDVSSFPTNMVIDKNGKTVLRKSGFGPNTVPELENKIASLVK
ncbi:TlpA family protein disulfide reductase [Aquimarina sp. AD1]|uniref:TlpA family protein disulfide reductase n=1 Tax=Aquimarina sp. (strain AD1) TaxID=1714848 RepID=UPI000E5036E6|nr:TlpA disulfide reductase family protein [Aquimarina sp. AD1]AXT54806.1 TlpA family protein disulfide reductase [Aquimarina sp. AD1]RKN20393.1 TlpA family protein disulfide reductase [Aquimarina sp. AD1]